MSEFVARLRQLRRLVGGITGSPEEVEERLGISATTEGVDLKVEGRLLTENVEGVAGGSAVVTRTYAVPAERTVTVVRPEIVHDPVNNVSTVHMKTETRTIATAEARPGRPPERPGRDRRRSCSGPGRTPERLGRSRRHAAARRRVRTGRPPERPGRRRRLRRRPPRPGPTRGSTPWSGSSTRSWRSSARSAATATVDRPIVGVGGVFRSPRRSGRMGRGPSPTGVRPPASARTPGRTPRPPGAPRCGLHGGRWPSRSFIC